MRRDAFLSDLRLATRTLRRSPGFTLAATLVLALAIGANGAVFGLLHAVLRTPPTGVVRSTSLVWIAAEERFAPMSIDYLRGLHRLAASSVDIAASVPTAAAFSSGDDPVRVQAQLVTANFFRVLGVRPLIGRTFSADEDLEATEGTRAVVVLSHDFWQSRFRGDRGVIGTTVAIDGHPFVVIGVTAPGFVGVHIESPAAFWVPTAMHGVVTAWAPPRLVGRLQAGVTVERATAALRGAAGALRDEPRYEQVRFTPTVSRLDGWIRPREARSLMPVVAIGWGIAAIVLLVVAANLANLMLVRAVARRREIGVRIALGAGRLGVVRLLVTEAVVLAMGAGASGTVLGIWGASLFKARFGGPLAQLHVTVDAVTIAFTIGVGLLAGAVVGAAPAWRASRPDVVRTLNEAHGAWMQRGRLQSLLTVVQTSLSVVLVAIAALFVRRATTLGTVRPGFDAAHVVSLAFDPWAHRYSEAQRTAFYDRVQARLERLPGVASVTVPTFAPLGRGAIFGSAHVPGRPARPSGPADRLAVMSVGAAFFRTIGATLLDGRDFTTRDMVASPRTAIVSESFARRSWPGERAVGKRFGIDTTAATIEVIGVARDIAFSGLGDEPFPHAYVPFTQGLSLPETHVLVRARGAPAAIIPALRAEIRAIDPTLPLFDVHTLAEEADRQLGVHRSLARLLAAFGTMALLLASIGLYGVVAFGVSTRRREIGIRMAIGARAETVVWLFVRDALRLAGIGSAIGLVLAIGGARVVTSAVAGLDPGDPRALLWILATLIATTVGASWLSARHAGRVDPGEVLRAD